MPPSRYSEFAILRGDPSDELPGVHGVGEKTARALIQAYDSLDDLLADAGRNDPKPGPLKGKPALRARLREAVDYLDTMREARARERRGPGGGVGRQTRRHGSRGPCAPDRAHGTGSPPSCGAHPRRLTPDQRVECPRFGLHCNPMPVYEYVCMECEGRFQRLLGMSDPDPACPQCSGDRVRRQLSVFAARTTSGSAQAGGSGGGGCACGGACACGH